MKRNWWPASMVAAAAYALIGFGTVALSRGAPGSIQLRAWRLAAWILSAVVFFVHVAHERRRLASNGDSALHASVGVALGTLAIAISAVTHQYRAGTLRSMVFSAIAVWPVATGVVSFAVAYVIARMFRAEASS